MIYKFNYFDALIFIRNLILEIRLCKNLSQIYGFILVNLTYVRYKYWIDYFRQTDIKFIIYDYDILMSKAMSLAFESLNIKSIAIQERPSSSFGSLYGVIVNTYLFGGKIYQIYGEQNNLFTFKNSYNLGMWRLSFFYDNKLVLFKSINFFSNKKKDIKSYRKKILFLGYFLEKNNEKVYVNDAAFMNFASHIKIIAKTLKIMQSS